MSPALFAGVSGSAARPISVSLLRRHRIDSDERSAQVRSLELRITRVQDRITRLTDLLIDGTLGKKDFHARKRALGMELAELQEERHRAAQRHLPPERMEKFLELMQKLSALHIFAKSSEKRYLVENAFSNRVVIGKNVELEPSNWLHERDFPKLSSLVTHIDTLIELFGPMTVTHRLNLPPEKTQ